MKIHDRVVHALVAQRNRIRPNTDNEEIAERLGSTKCIDVPNVEEVESP